MYDGEQHAQLNYNVFSLKEDYLSAHHKTRRCYHAKSSPSGGLFFRLIHSWCVLHKQHSVHFQLCSIHLDKAHILYLHKACLKDK